MWPRSALELGIRIAGIKFVENIADSVLFSGWLGIGDRWVGQGLLELILRRLPRVEDGCFLLSHLCCGFGKGLGPEASVFSTVKWA